MANPTEEFMLPISYGLLEHLPKFGCNRMTIYLWLHFHKTIKGEEKSIVSFTYSELADFFKASKSTVHSFIDELRGLHYIEMLETKTGRRGLTRVKILKDKAFKDFIRVTRNVLPSERIDKVNRSPQRTNKPLIVLPSERIDKVNRSPQRTNKPLIVRPSERNVLPSERIGHENPMKPGATESPIMVECNKENVINTPAPPNTSENPKIEKPVPVPEEIPLSPEFVEFWKIYPLQIDKAEAIKCWMKRLKEGFTTENILLAATHYAEECRILERLPKFMKHPSTFLGSTIRFTRPFTFEGYIEWTPPKVSASASINKKRTWQTYDEAQEQFAQASGEESRF